MVTNNKIFSNKTVDGFFKLTKIDNTLYHGVIVASCFPKLRPTGNGYIVMGEEGRRCGTYTHPFPSYALALFLFNNVTFKFYLSDAISKENKILSLRVLLAGQMPDPPTPNQMCIFFKNQETQLSSASIYHLTL